MSGYAEFPAELIETEIWTDELVAGAGMAIRDSPFVSVGGGLGSFAVADYLRISGLGTDAIRVLGSTVSPWQTYRYLAKNSQIPDGERLRSDSASVMDNVWGFPSYAFREAVAERSVGPVLRVVTEPILSEHFTPRAGQVYASVAREAARIRYAEMLEVGQVRMLRRRLGGGYFTILTLGDNSRVAFRSTHAHLAVGYPGVRFLPDLRLYRETYNDYAHVVNAYEPHDHVYEEMLQRPGTVLVRGSGIVASRVLQRLLDDREQRGAKTTVWHLFRNYVDGAQGRGLRNRRRGGAGLAYQPFNYPKAAWGGQLREKLFGLSGDEKRAFIAATGGTNTAHRRRWARQLARGESGGWYRQSVGTVDTVAPSPNGGVRTRVRTAEQAVLELDTDFVVDATGLQADVCEHRVIADLLERGTACKNEIGRLATDDAFALVGCESGPGRLYASGPATLGSSFAPVDSFLGLQYAALSISDDLARRGFTRRLGPWRSVRHWCKWMTNKAI